jgi:hypothetical protein
MPVFSHTESDHRNVSHDHQPVLRQWHVKQSDIIRAFEVGDLAILSFFMKANGLVICMGTIAQLPLRVILRIPAIRRIADRLRPAIFLCKTLMRRAICLPHPLWALVPEFRRSEMT